MTAIIGSLNLRQLVDAWRQRAPSISLKSAVRAIPWRSVLGSASWFAMTAFLGLFLGLCIAILPTQLVEIPMLEVGIVVVLFLWSLRNVRAVPLRTARLLFLAYVVVFCTLPIYLAITMHGLPWISLHRVLLALLAILFGYSVGGSPKVRETIAITYRANRTLFRLIIAVFGAFALSVPLSVSPMGSVSEMAQGCLQWVLPFFLCVLFVRTEEDTDMFVRLLIICLVITVLEAVAEFYIKDKIWTKLLPGSFFENNPIYLATFQSQTREGLYRASANFSVPLSFGEFCALLSPFCLYFTFHARKLSDRFLGIAGFFAVAGGLLLSGARGGVVGFLISSLVFAFLFCLRMLRNRRSSLVGAVLSSFFAVAIMMLPILIMASTRLEKKVLGGQGATQTSTDARFEQWSMAIPHIRSNPITGHGLGRGAEVVGWMPPSGLFYSLDSYIMTFLVETGLIGLLTFFSLLFFLIWRNGKLYLSGDPRTTLGAAICASICGFAINRVVLSQFENHTTLFLIMALSATMACRLVVSATNDAEPKRRRPGSRRPLPPSSAT